MTAIWRCESRAPILPLMREQWLQLNGSPVAVRAVPRSLPAKKESLEIQGIGVSASSASGPCGETPARQVNLRLRDRFCPHLLLGFREREEYFHQCQTPGNETIFRDYVGGEPNT